MFHSSSLLWGNPCKEKPDWISDLQAWVSGSGDISDSLYYTWSKEFLEAGKRRLSGDTARQATSPEVKDLRSEAMALKECVADLTLENRLLKKSMTGAGEFEE